MRYLPLDPLSPLARTAFMLADSGARLIVTDTRNVSRAYELASQQLVVLDIDALDQRLCTDNPGLSIPPDTLASMYYTSGSTGQPKGVVAKPSHSHGQCHAHHQYPAHLRRRPAHPALRSRLQRCGQRHVRRLAEWCPAVSSDLRLEGREPGPVAQGEDITIYHSPPPVLNFVDTLAADGHFRAARSPPGQRLCIQDGYRAVPPALRRHVPSPQCLGATEAPFFRPYFIDKTSVLPGPAVALPSARRSRK